MARLQTFAVVVAGIFDEKVVLQHLFGNGFGQEALVLLRRDPDEMGLLASHFLQVGQNAFWGVVIGGTMHTSAQEIIAVLDDGLDEFAWQRRVSRYASKVGKEDGREDL